ncbi:hypothetical protein TNCV_4568151 [Trichonephila clavipes]|nr:hypothetical protein TNCV_4568151 [Trichonephila clavipes]
MSEEGLVEHILARLEPPVQDYVEVRNPSTRAQLLQVVSKPEQRYSSRVTQGSRTNYNRERRDWDVRRMSTKYPRYPIHLIENLITSIPHTNILSSLDLRSGYFQLAVKRSDVVKTAFVTKNAISSVGCSTEF